MSLFGALFLISSLSPIIQGAYAEEECPFFKTNTILYPGKDGYTAKLTFSVYNTCKGNQSALTSVKVAKSTEDIYLEIICNIAFVNGSTVLASGCEYDADSQMFSAKRHTQSRDGDTWILVGELQNGEQFNKTVAFSPQDTDVFVQYPLLLTVAAAVGTVILILLTILVAVCCTQKKTSHASQSSPQAATHLHRPFEHDNMFYLHPVRPAVEQDVSNAQSAEAQPQRYNTQPEEDEEGYTVPNLSRPTTRTKT